MAKFTAGVLKLLIVCITIVTLAFGGLWFYSRRPQPTSANCPDGPRNQIDLSEFQTKYFGYTGTLEVKIKEQAFLSAKIEPKQLTQLSEAFRDSQEFRKVLIAAYNSCILSKEQWSQQVRQFQQIDNLAREIQYLLSASPLTSEQNTKLATLINEYQRANRNLAQQGKDN